MTIRTVIADDEPLARDKVKTHLAEDPDIEIVAECCDGLQTVNALVNLKPDLLFLDVQMPELDGFGVLDKMAGGALPAIVFVTAFDRYALRAFEVHALDYLLKPFDRARFQSALNRAKKAVTIREVGEVNRKLLALLADLRAGKRQSEECAHVERFMIKSRGRVFFLNVNEIDWIEAAGNYVRLHVGTDNYLLRDTMKSMEAKLDPKRFLRVHRAAMVRLDAVQELQPGVNGEYLLTLSSGRQVRASRGYRGNLRQLLSA